MTRSFGFKCLPYAAGLGAALALPASAAPVTFQGADLSDPSLALYVQAEYTVAAARNAPTGAPADPGRLRLQRAQVVVLTQASDAPKGYRRLDLVCHHNTALAEAPESQRFARGLEGAALWLDCRPGADAAFLPQLAIVVREARRLGLDVPQRCAKPGQLGTRSVAVFPLGHQELCLEDWAGQRDPVRRFEAEYAKRYAEP